MQEAQKQNLKKLLWITFWVAIAVVAIFVAPKVNAFINGIFDTLKLLSQ